MQQLTAPDPILFYDNIVLYEDELADNGCAILNVRVRVMPSCFLVLLRFFLRVDKVLFRVYDTRYFHSFGSSELIKHVIHKEQSYDEMVCELM